MTSAVGADKRAARIARRIEADVIRRDWPIGESLGSEAALQQKYGVSRAVLREAVRLVEHHRVARMRPGPRGGLFVTMPDVGPATRAMVIYLEYLGITLPELLDARMVLEPLAAGLAAERVDEVGIIRLRGMTAADDFLVMLAELARNPVLEPFLDVLSRLSSRYAGTNASGGAADDAAIVEAITAGDSAQAKMLAVQRVTTGSGLRGAPARTQARVAGQAKRAEVLAAEIHTDIAAAGWPIGLVLGGEAELVERYGVSRSVLREAVRLLEHHTVAGMRRGPGGGLIVTEPQPDAAVDAIALYLEYRRPEREDLRLVRDAIEVANVAKVVARHTEPDVRAFVAANRDAEITGAAEDPSRAGLVEYTFHNQLAELAGNRVLTLFLRILVELFGRHWTPTMRPMPAAGDAEQMYHAHARIVDAIHQGDDGIARHRSRRHLEALSSWWV